MLPPIHFCTTPNENSIDEQIEQNTKLYIADIIKESKKSLQSAQEKNGITAATIGSSGCGKTTFIKTIFIDNIFSTTTEKDVRNYGKCINKKRKRSDEPEPIVQIFTESPDADAFQNLPKDVILDPCGFDIDNINLCYQINRKTEKKFRFVFVLDDCIHVKGQKIIEKMFLVMRNTNISSIISLQYPKLIPLSVRSSVYYTFLFHQNNLEPVEAIVIGWMSAYLEGKTVRDKMSTYVDWTRGGNGHRFYMLDNLQKKCYRVDENYYCEQLHYVEIEK